MIGDGGGRDRGTGSAASHGRNPGDGHRHGFGQGVRQCRRDGSGGGAAAGRSRDVSRGAGIARRTVAFAPAPALPPAETETRSMIVTRPRTVAVVAHLDRCTLCEACLDACPRGAITLGEAAKVDAVLCSGCGACDNVCPNGVFELAEV